MAGLSKLRQELQKKAFACCFAFDHCLASQTQAAHLQRNSQPNQHDSGVYKCGKDYSHTAKKSAVGSDCVSSGPLESISMNVVGVSRHLW
jgi:hypothetical protein